MDTGSKKTPQTKQEADDKDNEEEQSDPLMKPEVVALKKCREKLVELITPSQLINMIDCFSKEEVKEIIKMENSNEKGVNQACHRFLEMLVMKDDFWDDLLDALEAIGDLQDIVATLKEGMWEQYSKSIMVVAFTNVTY